MSRRRKRLLLVAHNFPPLASGGVHRPVKFARYLPDHGWDVEVLTVKNIRYHAYDPTLLEELATTPIHRAGSVEPLRLLWLAGWRPRAAPPVPASFAELEALARAGATATVPGAGIWLKRLGMVWAQPDYECPWVPFAAAYARRLHRRWRFDAVLTTSPPESGHFVGLNLKKFTAIPWVVDFRDEWTHHHLKRHLGAVNQYVNGIMERRVLAAADAVIANTEGAAANFRKRTPAATPVVALPNGFDPADLGAPFPKARADDVCFVHNGSFRGGRRALVLLTAFAAARQRDTAFARRAKLYLIGINRRDDAAAVAAWGLGDAVFVLGYIPHRLALRACRGADWLVLSMSAAEGPNLIPGKIYEYLGVERPVLAAAPPGEARELLAAATEGAVIVGADDVDAAADGFLGAFAKPGGGGYAVRPEYREKFDRRTQVAQLAALLDAVT